MPLDLDPGPSNQAGAGLGVVTLVSWESLCKRELHLSWIISNPKVLLCYMSSLLLLFHLSLTPVPSILSMASSSHSYNSFQGTSALASGQRTRFANWKVQSSPCQGLLLPISLKALQRDRIGGFVSSSQSLGFQQLHRKTKVHIQVQKAFLEWGLGDQSRSYTGESLASVLLRISFLIPRLSQVFKESEVSYLWDRSMTLLRESGDFLSQWRD